MRSIVAVLLVLLLAMLTVTSCARTPPPSTARIPAIALAGGGAVYAAFIKDLGKGPHDNDFTRFASNPANYTVSILDYGDTLIYKFVLQPYHGRLTIDDSGSYVWTKHDGKIEVTGRH